MLVSIADYFTACFLPQPPLLRGQVHRPMSESEFTEACECMLMQAERHRCPYWLLDSRRDAHVRMPDVYDWLTDEFLPRVRTALGQAPCIACVAPASFWHELQAAAPLPLANPDVAYRARAFTTEADARQWLQWVGPAATRPAPTAYQSWHIGN